MRVFHVQSHPHRIFGYVLNELRQIYICAQTLALQISIKYAFPFCSLRIISARPIRCDTSFAMLVTF